MTLPKPPPGAACIRRPRFRVRTLLLSVAAAGLLFGILAAVPTVVRRRRVAQAIEAALSTGPELGWSFNPINAPRRDEFLHLLSDRERVLDSLHQAVEQDPDDTRRIHAIRTMRSILKQPGPFESPERSLHRVLDLLSRTRLSGGVETELAAAVGDWVSLGGLDSRRRGEILTRAKRSTPALLPAWAAVLARIGGREETAFLVGLGDTHEPALLGAIHNSPLVRSCWPGLLPAMKGWLDDPMVAPHIMKYSILSQTPAGRDLLLAYALSDAHPPELRRRAVERLQDTVAGTGLLLNAATNPESLKILHAGLGDDLIATCRGVLTRHEAYNGEALWSELIDGVDPNHPNRFPSPATAVEKAANEAESRVRRHTRESSLRCLRWITGRADLQTWTDWRRWYTTTRPAPLPQRELIKLVLDHPESLETTAILRRVVPHHLGELPADCVPLYEMMAKEGPPASRYWACTALLLYTPKTDATPIVIDLVGRTRPEDVGTQGSGPLELLKQRFAENYFFDVTAWREWWAE